MTILEIFQEYGALMALPLIINAILSGAKKGVPILFKSAWGVRLSYLYPIVLGAIGGIFLSVGSMQDNILIGMALGAISHLIYKLVSKTLASSAKNAKQLQIKIDADLAPEDSDE